LARGDSKPDLLKEGGETGDGADTCLTGGLFAHGTLKLVAGNRREKKH